MPLSLVAVTLHKGAFAFIVLFNDINNEDYVEFKGVCSDFWEFATLLMVAWG